ncbi:glycosyltransferase [Streptomyces sp. NPDC048389]|uniref:glycosyltransferase n=1 Tax=Streptomyces sp. NPDC048389 TaxID=3154622 RepID=UPI0034518E3A
MSPQGSRSGRPLSVAVLMELVRTPASGGQVKCWERFAEAAAAADPAELGIDLTVYVLGRRHHVEALSPRGRFVALHPVASTALMSRKGGVDVSDVAPHHPGLARLLPHHDVWHMTHVLAFGATAARLRRRTRRHAGATHPGVTHPGLVASVHTDVPALTYALVRESVNRRLGRLPALRSLDPAALCESLVNRRRDRILTACDRILVATPSQVPEMSALVGADRVSRLGRGVDLDRFRPDPAARAALASYGVPVDRTLVLFAGRVDASKRVLLLAEALRRLRAEGRPVHLVIAGTGPETVRVSRLLGPDVTLVGVVPQQELARLFAGCDIFAFPSRSETIGNVVGEAMACGTPVVLPRGTNTNHWLARPSQDGVLVDGDTPVEWATALETLIDDPAARAAMGRNATATVLTRHRGWGRVLMEDLLPVWRGVAASASGG